MTTRPSHEEVEVRAPGQEPDPDGEIAEYEWSAAATVAAALDADRDVSIALTCRGSAHPKALDWLIDLLLSAPGRWLDVGAGLGGPSAYLQRRNGISATLLEPAVESARGAARLHALPIIRATADRLPVPGESFGRVWALGALSATMNPEAVLDEIARVVEGGGRLGLYEYVSTTTPFDDPATGNSFVTLDKLMDIARHSWSSVADVAVAELGSPSTAWVAAQDAADRLIDSRSATVPARRHSKLREQRMANLLTDGHIRPHLIVLERNKLSSPNSPAG